jgi:hypothetical protein
MTAEGKLWLWAGNLDIDRWPVRFVGISAGPVSTPAPEGG